MQKKTPDHRADPGPASANALQRLEAEYHVILPQAEMLAREVENQLGQVISSKGIALGFPIQSRVKAWASIAEKLQRVSLTLDNLRQLQDLVGLRIILLFRRDVKAVASLITEHFSIVRSYDTAERLKEDQFGYASLHMVVELKGTWLALPTLAALGGLRIEIQVRTLAQHIWAMVSQTLQYKQEQAVPPTVIRSIHRASALLETIDLEFDRVLSEREGYRKDLQAGSPAEEMNVDLLESILDRSWPAANRDPHEEYAELLGELTHFRVRSKEELEALIARHGLGVLAEERTTVAEDRKRLQENQPLIGTTKKRAKKGVYYTHTGLTRRVMDREFGERWREFQSKLLSR